jgi:hypothetical protein
MERHKGPQTGKRAAIKDDDDASPRLPVVERAEI